MSNIQMGLAALQLKTCECPWKTSWESLVSSILSWPMAFLSSAAGKLVGLLEVDAYESAAMNGFQEVVGSNVLLVIQIRDSPGHSLWQIVTRAVGKGLWP